MDKTAVYMALFALVAVAIGIAWMHGRTEHFEEPKPEEPKPEPEPEQGQGTKYSARTQVIEMFNLLLDRNPTTSEMKKYEHMTDPQDISSSIMADNTPSPSPSPTPPVDDSSDKATIATAVQQLRSAIDALTPLLA